MKSITIALAQINTTVGDLEGNCAKIRDYTLRASEQSARIAVFPELAVSGYPPEDLVLKNGFLNDCEQLLGQLAGELPPEMISVVGVPYRVEGAVRNAAAVLSRGKVQGIYSKMLLPNYGVFDEKRHFSPGETGLVLDVDGLRIGLHICEDSWFPEKTPTRLLQQASLHALINLSASPYFRHKLSVRELTLAQTARTLNAPLFYCNLIGGQDELVFDGASMIFDRDGRLTARAGQFEEALLVHTLSVADATPAALPPALQRISLSLKNSARDHAVSPVTAPFHPLPGEAEEVYRALMTGLRDYVNKNGFRRVVVALSGGIDSALVLILAVDALGTDRVAAVTMPSRFTSDDTLSDAGNMAAGLGVEFHTIPIKTLHEEYLRELSPIWEGRAVDTTEENLQARIRGNIIMALSNKFGWLVLTTGNKSEMATGYCTLYGDMAGGFAVIKDVPKTLVFELCRWRNSQNETPVIPPSIITRPPTAELRANQKDSDSLPPYEILDAIIERYVEFDMGVQEIIDQNFDPATVERVARLIDLNEYKRRQGPPGIKITPKSFGRDRRMPITNRYGRSTKRNPGSSDHS